MEAIVSAIAFLALIALLFGTAITDIRERTIPNRLVAAVVAVWVVWRIALIALGISTLAFVVIDLVGALAFGAALLAFVTIAERLTGRFMLGGGDIKLLAAVALFLGINGILVALFAACIVSLAYAAVRLKRGIPFAPCILCGTLISLML